MVLQSYGDIWISIFRNACKKGTVKRKLGENRVDVFFFVPLAIRWCSWNQCVFMVVVNVVFLSENRFERNDGHKNDWMQSENKVLSNKFILRVLSIPSNFHLIQHFLSLFFSSWCSWWVRMNGEEKRNEFKSKKKKLFSGPLMFEHPWDTCQVGSSLMHTSAKYLLMYWEVRFNKNHLKTSTARWTTHNLK